MIKLKIKNEIKIKGLPNSVRDRLIDELSLPNPKYHKVLNSNSIPTRAIYSMEKEFKYYKKLGSDGLVVPRGLRSRLFDFFDALDLDYEVIADDYIESSCSSLDSSVTLREYQKPIVDKIVNEREGVLRMDTGKGKTIVMLEVAERLGLTTTVLVKNKSLQSNWQKECKKHFNHDPNLINAKNKQVKDINIATFGSLYNNHDLKSRLSDNTSILIVDECHGAVSNERVKVIKSFKCKYIFGCTATMMRSDGKEKAIKFIFGNKIADFSEKQLNPKVEVVTSRADIPVDNFQMMVEDQIHNKNRNKLITGLTFGEGICEGNKVLVLVKRKKHGRILENMLPDSDMIIRLDGDVENRNEIIHKLKTEKKDFRILIGISHIFSEGIDIPPLNVLILACSIKSEKLTIQSVGRIMREFPDKDDPKIIDILDHKNYIFNNHFKQRLKVYRKNNWDIEGLPPWYKK